MANERIAKYIQHLALKPNKFPDQEEYERDFGGVNSWVNDAVLWVKRSGVDIKKVKDNLQSLGAACDRYRPEPETAGMRRQYFLDCVRKGEVLPIDP